MRVESKGTGLVITPEILSSIKNQDFTNIPKKFFSFYAEYINATTALGGLSLGCIAMESILPHGKDARIDILGEDLYYRIFSNDKNIGRKQGFRNRIFHGIYFDDGDSTQKDYEDLLEAIKLALLSKNKNIGDIFSLQKNFKNIPRQKTRIDGYGGIFLRSTSDYKISIKDLVNSDNILFYEFQKNIQNEYGIKTDIHLKIENY
ncbi:hypothetical protein H7169_02495 [Candidatus Gracilibacteria bacterium]|nr:hypothetical protein [Candidatus Gracilibacteria bacterium]